MIGGGARSPLWGRILASALGRPLAYRDAAEVGPALGAARLARLCVDGDAPESVCNAPPVVATAEPDAALADALAPKLAAFRDTYRRLRAD